MALDGYLAGVPHREIAVAMFEEERVARDWADPSICATRYDGQLRAA